MSLIQFSNCLCAPHTYSLLVCTSDRCMLQLFYTSFVYGCKGLQMPRNQVFMMGNLGRKRTHEHRQGKEGRAEEGPQVLITSVPCDPQVKSVKGRGCLSATQACIPISRYPMPFICAHHGNKSCVLPQLLVSDFRGRSERKLKVLIVLAF